MTALQILAGSRARQHIEQNGLRADDIKVMAGASGGPKWFVLAMLDRHLFGEFFADRSTPLHLLGSSAGGWRFACFAQSDPVAASKRLCDSYMHLRYPKDANIDQITEISKTVLDDVIGDGGEEQIVTNPIVRLNLIVARSRYLNAAELKPLQLAALSMTAAANLVNRRLLGHFFERVIFHHPKEHPPFYNLSDLPTRQVPLTKHNVRKAILATGSIPLVLRGVRDIPGAPRGVYRDGGITDYHFDLPFSNEGLVLYPHFYPRAIPGWFDKPLPWRLPAKQHYDNVLMLAPSEEFVASLPYQKIPDRNDFTKMDDTTRIRYWQQTVDASERLVEAFKEFCDDPLAQEIKPIESS